MDCHHFVTDGYHKFLEGLEARHDFCNLVIVFHAKFIASTQHASQLLFPGTWFMQLDIRKTNDNSHNTIGSKYTVPTCHWSKNVSRWGDVCKHKSQKVISGQAEHASVIRELQ